MHTLVEDTIFYLRRLKKRYIFGCETHVSSVENSITLAPAPEVKIHTAPPPKPLEITPPKSVSKQTKIELQPLEIKPASQKIQSDVLQQIGIPLLDVPLDDSTAKRVRFGYKDKKYVPEIPILLSGNTYKPFLDNVAKAITSRFGTSRVLRCDALEEKKKWAVLKDADAVKLFILPDIVLGQYSALQAALTESNGKRLLFGKPLLLLPDLSLYMNDPDLKRSLWNILCAILDQ